jgi:hypothetical protein
MITKIEFKHHMFMLCLATALWAYYLLGGLSSSYYQNWPFLKTLIIVDIIPGLFLIPIGVYLFKSIIGHDYFIASIWAAIYGSFPLALYDHIYLSTVYDVSFINYLENYWYLSSFHIVPWIVFPSVGFVLSKRKIHQLRRRALSRD